MYCIARPKNGIALNGDEYASYPGTGRRAEFNTEDEALFALMYYGYTEADMEREGVYIKEIPDENGDN